MVEIRGWIILPCEFDEEAEMDAGSDWRSIFNQIMKINDGSIAHIKPTIQNAMVGISIFDFSNHAGQKLDKLDLILEYLKKVAHDIQANILFTDEETETVREFVLGSPCGSSDVR